MLKRNHALFATVVAATLTVLGLSQCNPITGSQRPDHLPVKLIRVHDGDTVSVIINRKKEKVRLIGIDAPELRQRPWGTISKKHLNKIFEDSGWSVAIELDIDQRDKYGRLLAYIWTRDGKMVNLEMIKGGHAVLYTIPPNVKHADEFREAQRTARENRLNIWGKKGLRQFPEDYRKTHSDRRSWLR